MSEQLQLPYVQITAVAGRGYLRENFKQTARASYFISFNTIKEREGFNSRIVYENIPELADQIFTEGLKDPFVLDILPDGTAFIEEGYRRFRAITLLIEQERWKPETLVEFYPNKAGVTELQRMANQYISNNNRDKKKLKPVEQAKVAWNVKNLYFEQPLSHEKVAEEMKCSRQTVDNLIKIAEADDRMKQEMITADMNITECLSLLKKKKILAKQSADAELDGNKNTAGKTAAPFDPNAKDLAELKAIEGEGNEDVDDQDDDLPFKEDKIEETPEAKEIRLAQELEQLLKIADEVKASKLKQHLGRKLAAAINHQEDVESVNTDDGEIKPQPVTKLFLNRLTILTEDIVEEIQNKGVKTVFLFKAGCEPTVDSVFTVAPEKVAKDKYDSGREEINDIQNVIKLSDRISVRVEKLDISEGDKKDLTDWCNWMRESALKSRDYIHANKKENKLR